MSWPVAISSCWGPPHSWVWDQALLLSFTRSLLLNLFSLLCCCTRGLYCVGLLPKCSLLLLVWSSPGCFQDHCSATMKRFTAVCCLYCCSARLLSVGLGPVVTPGFTPGLSLQAQGLLNQNVMLAWPNVQLHNCCTHKGVLYLAYYIYRGFFLSFMLSIFLFHPTSVQSLWVALSRASCIIQLIHRHWQKS